MHWDKSPKETPCYPQRTVKRLLEEKRKRETASEPSACSEPSSCSTTTVPVCTAETSLSTGMAVGYYGHWAPGGPGLDPTGPFGYYSSSPAGGSAAYIPATVQQGFNGDAVMASHANECSMTSSTSSYWPWLVAPGPPQASVGGPQASVGGPQASVGGPQAVWGPPDAVRLQEARMFLTGMDHALTGMDHALTGMDHALTGMDHTLTGMDHALTGMDHTLTGMDHALTTCQDEDGDTILHIYSAKGLREHALAAAERLRAVGRLDAKEHKGKTALLVAVTANQPLIVADLLALGSDANACDVHGQTALHLAATYGFPDALQVLLLNGPGVNLEARNFEGLTPLHCATMAHGLAMKSQSRGASVTDVGLQSMKSLHGSRGASVTDVGLQSKAAETFGMSLGDVSLQSEASETFSLGDVGLQSKAEETFSCLQMLLVAGADLTSQEIKSNATSLHLAVKDGNTELVTYLLFCCPLLDCSGKDFVNMKAHGHTALHMAAGLHGNQRQEEMLRLLLSKGADASVRNHENQQPAHLLQSGPHGDKLKLLLKKKRSVSSRRRCVQ